MERALLPLAPIVVLARSEHFFVQALEPPRLFSLALLVPLGRDDLLCLARSASAELVPLPLNVGKIGRRRR